MSELDELIGDLKMTRSILETTVMENLDLKEQLKNTQAALKVVIAEKLKDLDGSRNKRVEAEREACRLLVAEKKRELGNRVSPQTTVDELRKIQFAVAALSVVEDGIRTRQEWL
jgi:hypothetical protein